MPATEAQIARINELSGLARTAWFTLLGYLVFVGITLLGVKDADFFVPTRQTDLPLVGVEIPTASFFWTAPILGAALYTYLHLFLIKLWDAHAEARTTDADATHHWLVNDFVLLRQRDPATRARPLAWLVTPITLLLVWAAAPIVLAYAWWRSMPAHNEWLTLLIATCLWLTLVVGCASWRRAEESFGRFRPLPWSTGAAVPASGLVACLLISASWLRTEGGLDAYVNGFWTLDDVSFTASTDRPVARGLMSEDLVPPLPSVDLAGVRLVSLPADWRNPETARAAFRPTWCLRERLSMDVCDLVVGADKTAPAWVDADRTAWCEAHGLDGECAARFIDADLRFAGAWSDERNRTRDNLPSVDLRGSDLRWGHLVGITLVGANLGGARLERANLRYADLEGAGLRWARMAGADLRGARLDEADLTAADLSGATLYSVTLNHALLPFASLRGAKLNQAGLTGTDLQQADLTSAWFDEADLTGADLRNAHLQRVSFRRAQLAGVEFTEGSVRDADLRAYGLSQAQLDVLVGSKDTLLPPYNDPETGKPLYVWSCWNDPPAEIDGIVAVAAGPRASAAARAKLLAEFICGPKNPRQSFQTHLKIDAPYPASHPLLGAD